MEKTLQAGMALCSRKNDGGEMTDAQDRFSRALEDFESLFSFTAPMKPISWCNHYKNTIREALQLSAQAPQGGVCEQLRSEIEQATKRSKYPWSQGGTYTRHDWKNEGCIEFALRLKQLIDAAQSGGVK